MVAMVVRAFVLWCLSHCFLFTIAHVPGDKATASSDHSHHHPHYCSSCAQAAAGRLSTVPHLVEPFSLKEARLLPGSFEWTAQQTNLEYLLSLPVSSLSWNFRKTSSLPTQGQPFGGWETPYPSTEGDDRGHFTGHFLSASALMVSATDNATLRANAEELVKILGECQAANKNISPRFGPGYLHASPVIYFDCLENLWRKPGRYMQVSKTVITQTLFLLLMMLT